MTRQPWFRRCGFGRTVRRAGAAVGMSCIVLLGTHTTQAQLETQAAHDTRAALRNVEQTYGSRAGWGAWSRWLAFEDIESELRLGDRARGGVMQSTAARLRTGAATNFRPAALQQLAEALERRAAELAQVPAAQWPAESGRVRKGL